MSSRWLPLESNPDVVNAYLKKLGIPEKWHCVDVYGFDEDVLAMVPKPVVALLLLFPITAKYESHAKEEATKLSGGIPSDVYFIKQSIENACGTIAIIHALANNEKRIDIGTGVFKKFLEASKSVKPEDRAGLLEKDEELTRAHETSAEEGQTRAPPRDAKIDLHFVAFCNVNGTLYELDGRKPSPIAHGSTSDENLLKDAAVACKKFIEREPENLNFTALAISGGTA
jgi:ubiquitin carboxyl-terminal hydrolase L3